MSRERRVVVTGLGVVSSLGNRVEPFWRACLEGRTVVEPIPRAWTRYAPLKSSLWSPLGDWDRPTPLMTRVERKQMDPSSQMALLAAEEALEAAGLETELADRKRNRHRIAACDGERAGVFIGTGVGGIHTLLASASFTFLSEAKKRLAEVAASLRGAAEAGDAADEAAAQLEQVRSMLPTPPVFNTFSVSMTMPNAVSAQLALKFGVKGPTPTFTCACASGTTALGQALRAVREGACDLALAGGAEYLSDEYGSCFRGFDAVGALVRPAAPMPREAVNRPFDDDRTGFLFAEGGAAVLALEDLERARARGAPLLAEVRGYGETCDAYSAMVMDPEGRQIVRALELCLADAGVDAGDVDYLNAHGTGTPANDPIECRAVRELFGRRVRVNSTKSLLGHTLGASGAIEAVVTVLSLRDGRTHPSKNVERPIADLAFVTRPEPFPIRHAVSQSFAFGGQNAAVAFSQVGA